MHDLNDLKEAVIEGQSEQASELVRSALGGGWAAETVLRQALLPAMAEVGAKFTIQEYFLPEMVAAAAAMKIAMAVLEPELQNQNARGRAVAHAATCVVGTVQGDVHDIGKNLVAAMLRGADFDVIDLGVNVPPAQFLEAVVEHRPQILGLSAMLSTTMPSMFKVMEVLQAAGARAAVKVIVGGAPITADFAEEIGADGFAPDAASAVGLVKSLLAAGAG
jgi:5-methyltetrahydrofolate--homocysteine methyltransferase